MPTYHIHITGIVQGVGFRPFVYKLAHDVGIQGWVSNTISGINCRVNARPEVASVFFERMKLEAPAISRIEAAGMEKVEDEHFSGFYIRESEGKGAPMLMITPDFALCENCRRELKSTKDRRNNYPFITCTYCGPRYSIITGVPYDRPYTTMAEFRMCPDCQTEYDSPADRRYYSQTNSCTICGIRLYDLKSGKDITIDEILYLLKRGKILALKGIGGFLLMCDATNKLVLRELRERKHRPGKPFAVMYPDLQSISADVEVHPKAAALLTGPVSPVCLLKMKHQLGSGLSAELVAPDLAYLGVMLPYTPLYELVLSAFGKPVVATSANISESPIVFRDSRALSDLSGLADVIISNDRPIVIPQDDSVVRFTRKEEAVIIRRSRGMSPSFFHSIKRLPSTNVLCMGASMKSTFTYLTNGSIYISQYLGDLESYDTEEAYRQTLEHFLNVFNSKPEHMVIDQHPDYFSSKLGKEMASELQVPVSSVQHHEAHFLSCLGENKLIGSNRILGVVWDGLGYGNDGMIWGGEFFLYDDRRINRSDHLAYFPVLAGDKMSREPRISALALLTGIGKEELVRSKFDDTEWQVYGKLLQQDDIIQTSSMGRVFDAVASLLDLMDVATYEGEAALLLEEAASGYDGDADSYPVSGTSLDTILDAVIRDIGLGTDPGEIAFRFHKSLATMIFLMADRLEVRDIALSGGVFQNTLLVDLVYELGGDYNLYFHKDLSPNDENISFGQLMHFTINQ